MELKFACCARGAFLRIVLIVPYGIEIHYRYDRRETARSFNRTLWN